MLYSSGLRTWCGEKEKQASLIINYPKSRFVAQISLEESLSACGAKDIAELLLEGKLLSTTWKSHIICRHGSYTV